MFSTAWSLELPGALSTNKVVEIFDERGTRQKSDVFSQPGHPYIVCFFLCLREAMLRECATKCFTFQQTGWNNIYLRVCCQDLAFVSLKKLNRNILFTCYGPDTKSEFIWRCWLEVHRFSTQVYGFEQHYPAAILRSRNRI